MTLFQIIPNYILINGIVIGGTVFVIFLVYRKLSSLFPKRLTVYFLKAACVSLVISLAVLAVVLTMMQFLLHYGMWNFFMSWAMDTSLPPNIFRQCWQWRFP